jgi:leucyl aminopeptidase
MDPSSEVSMAKRAGGIGVELTGAQAPAIEAAFLAVPVFQEDLRSGGTGAVRAIDAALGGQLLASARSERFEGKADQQLALPTLGRARAGRVVLVGLGPRARSAGWARAGYEPLRMAAGRAARAATRNAGGALAFVLPEVARDDVAQAVRAAAEGALLGGYRFERYKSAKQAEREGFGSLLLAVPPAAARDPEVKAALDLARRVAAAVAWARDLVNLAPVDCTPSALAEAARALARGAGLAVEVRGPKEIAALRMGLFMGVTRGSAEPPRLVKVSYQPRGAGARKPPVVLVGKAITFDSGGLSLKPTDSMVTMHTDMAGSAAVLGAMQVIAQLEPPFPVHAVLGACENMPGGRAYKPSDVLASYAGKTVEVTNTDAEGRLVLGDVLAWAVDTLRPAAVVDVATLTGACMVALGPTTAGLFGTDGPAIEGMLAAAQSSGEDIWRMPMVEALAEQVKGERADLKNTGERWGGAISAAHFLREFVGEVPWAHLDIAGPSHATKERGYVPKGGTGFGVRTLVELVRGWIPRALPERARRA